MAGKVVVDQIEDSSANVGGTTDMIKGSARAWINFDGTGVISIRDSYNIDSITDLGVGIHKVTITTGVFANANYAVVGMVGGTASGYDLRDYSDVHPKTATSVTTTTRTTATADLSIVSLAFFG